MKLTRQNVLGASYAPLVHLFFAVSALQAEVVYDNDAGGHAGINGGVLSDDRSPAYVADDVTLNKTIGITGIEWTGMFLFGDEIPPASDMFTIAFYADSADDPSGGAPLAQFLVGDAVNRTDSGIDYGTADVYDFSASIDFSMTAGVTYWLAIYNDTEPDDDRYYWGMLNGQGNSFFSGDGGSTWDQLGHRHDFRLLAAPESGMPNGLILISILLITRKARHVRSDCRQDS